ncbi:glycosyltransferase family 2 protein [bacterium]|nr:glycosyltransferase family 2 protein [bacterium]MBU1675349.1 glycosyltransferase family 2 protein [bacterium]
MSRISVVVLTYKRREAVLALLRELVELRDHDLEVIVVDNGSEDGTAEAVAERHPAVELIVLRENRGVGARNEGLALAGGGIVVTLDDDMRGLDETDLRRLRTVFTERPRLGALCFKVTRPDADEVRDWVHHRPVEDADGAFDTYEITEGAVAYRATALAESGFYREDFFISHEGLELAYRLLDRGWEIAYDGSLSVEHHHAAGGRSSWRRYYYDTRNLFWVATLHQPLGYAVRYLALGATAMGYYALRDGFLPTWLRAVRDGLRGISGLRPERRTWSAGTRAFIRGVDAGRPGFLYLARKRMRQKDFSLE